MNYRIVYNIIISDLYNYVHNNNLKSLVLGISGGIDSTLCAIICREVCNDLGIKFIGVSLPIKNEDLEYNTSVMVGNTFCENFAVCGNLSEVYHEYQKIFTSQGVKQTPIANGNIQARLRMIYLYNLAGLNNGIVIDTCNFTEYNLGFFTRHGDEGDYMPLIGLYKTEVYGLAEYLATEVLKDKSEIDILRTSMGLTPTDGLGISSSDLEQIGANSYNDVDIILKYFLSPFDFTCTESVLDNCISHFEGIFDSKVITRIFNRMINSKFKRCAIPGTSRSQLESILS